MYISLWAVWIVVFLMALMILRLIIGSPIALASLAYLISLALGLFGRRKRR